MRTIYLFAGVFCLYAIATRSFQVVELMEAVRSYSPLLPDYLKPMHDMNVFQLKLQIICLILFTAIVSIWVIAGIKKKERLKVVAISATFVVAILMSMLDNMETSFYISDAVVGSEILY